MPKQVQDNERGRLNHTTAKEADASPNVVTGTILIPSVPTLALYDSGATHSFVSKKFSLQQELETVSLKSTMVAPSPGSVMRTKLGCIGVPIEINGIGFKANLIMIDTPNIDIILRMD